MSIRYDNEVIMKLRISNSLIIPTLICLQACGGSSGSQSTPNTSSDGTKVLGAANQAACESAANNDATACFVIDQNSTQAKMYGVIASNSPSVVNQLIAHTPKITEILMVNVPGSMDDEANIPAALAVRNAGINTRINSNGLIASGGTDFFLAGVIRTVENGARIGVHSWSTGDGTEGAQVPENDPQHQLYINYYQQIGLSAPSGFYWFTLRAAPSSGIHYMTADEITQYGISTPVIQKVKASEKVITINNENIIAESTIMLEQTDSVYITGDSLNNRFVAGTGVSHINGGEGEDSVLFEGRPEEYSVYLIGDETIITDSFYERNGVVTILNIENIVFEGKRKH